MMQFGSIGAFLLHLSERAMMATHAQTHALDVAARIVQDEAKHEIGVYQAAAGPFGAWPDLADATKKDRSTKGYPENEPLLREGNLRDSIERTHNEHEAEVGSNSDIAVYQEIGTQRIPPRSFLGHAAIVKEKEVVEAIALEVIHAVSGVRPNRL